MSKKVIREKKQEFSFWDIDGMNISEIIKYFTEIKEKLGHELILNVDLYGDYDNDSEFYIERQETNEEYELRIKNEEDFKNKKERDEYRQYQMLKKKFENETSPQ